MGIEVGEYIRTENGEIHKVEDIEDLRIHIKTEKIMFRSWVEDYYGCHKEDRFIIKHSKNIIDLIETGDYVNGGKVQAVNNIRKTIVTIINIYYEDEIKTIVTKEQFKEMEYRVNE